MYLEKEQPPVPLKGKAEGPTWRLEEFNGKRNVVTGVFAGTFDDRVFRGYWTGPQGGNSVPFKFELEVPVVEESKKGGKKKIKYEVTSREDEDFIDEIVAYIDGERQVVISPKEDYCYILEDTRDFDADGYDDLLIRDFYGCGGSCCPLSNFFFISYHPEKGFVESDEFGEAGETTIKKENGQWTVSLWSAGELTPRGFIWIDEKYMLKEGKAVQVYEKIYDKVLDALVEIKSQDFESMDSFQKTVLFDIDGDGKKDKLTGDAWGRMNNINWTIEFSNGKKAEGSSSCNRIGVLPSKTKGVHDLVVNLAEVWKWNGREYVEGE